MVGAWALATVSLAAQASYTAFEAECVVDSSWSHYTSAELFIEGSILMEEGFWHEAERVWSHAIETRPKNRVLKYKRALCLFEIADNWVETKAAFEEVVDGHLTLRYDPFNPNQVAPPIEAWLGLASTEHRLGEFDAARLHVEKFLEKAGEKHASTEWAAKILSELRFAEMQLESPTSATVAPVEFNSEAHETHPVMTADGRTLYFSSNRSRSNGSNHGRVDPNTKEHFQDIYRAELNSDSTWSEPELLNIGLRYHSTVVGSDAFGEKLVVLDNDGWTSELKVTQRWERGWTPAEPFVLDKNIPNQGEIVFFPNKDRLIASVKSRRGEGGFDLYESRLDDKGKWSKLKSLGNRVNTWGDEVTPFVAADGQTVFFASNGLQNMGGFDIYRTTRNAAGGWTEPEHLGSPINSVDDDLAFVIGGKGQVGYFASRREVTSGDLDLYEAQMNGRTALEREVVILRLDAESVEEEEQPEVLVVKDAETGEVVQRVEKGKVDDVYNFILPAGRDFVVESEAEMALVDGEEEKAAVPAVSRRLSLPAGGKAEVVDATFEEVFLAVESKPEGEEAGEAVAYVVKATTPETKVDEQAEVEAEEEEAEDSVGLEQGGVSGERQGSEGEAPNALENDQGVEAEADPVSTTAVAAATSLGSQVRSEPIAPLALGDLQGSTLVMATQLYSGQVHTERMNLDPVIDAVALAAKKGLVWVRIEGSASDGPSTRSGGNLELASSRAMDVYLRLRSALESRGLTKDADYAIRVVRRVQPDGETPAAFNDDSTHPASFQYVRVDLSVE